MKNRLIWIIFIPIIFEFFACRNTKALMFKETNLSEQGLSNETWRSDSLFDIAWFETLQSNKQQIKTIWQRESDALRLFSEPRFRNSYNIFTTEEEMRDCEIIPTEVYEMNVKEFKKLPDGYEGSIDRFLTLRKDKAQIYIVKDKKFYYFYMLHYNEGIWSQFGYGPLSNTFSNTMNSLMYQKKYKIFNIYIPKAFTGFCYVVYKENDTIYYINSLGVLTKFIDELKRIL